MRPTGVAAAGALVLTAALVQMPGCGGDGIGGGPVPVAGGGGAAGGSSGGAGGEAGAAPVKRTVAQRNPFGNVAKSNNLLWDGDFEWRSAFASQYGWLSGSSPNFLSFALPKLELGPRCRSGIKCARLDASNALLGLAVASKDHDLAVSFWTAVEGDSCAEVESLLFTESFYVPAAAVLPETEVPDGEGWCRFSGLLAEAQSAPSLFIHNQGSGTVVVDDVVVEPVSAEQSQAMGLSPPVEVPAAVRAWARAARRPWARPVPEARVRFERSMRGKRWGRRWR